MDFDNLTLIQRLIVSIPPIVLAITVHEVAHGWTAKQLGDKTAYLLGRLTLNPIKHIDLLGTLIIPALLIMTGTGFIFGWAKPVPVDGRYFKKPITDMAIVAAAGPLSNLIMALAWALIAHLGVLINTAFFTVPLIKMAETGITINLVLFLLNLIPIPPLDGSRVLTAFLSPNLAWKYNRIEPYGFYILIALLYFNIISLLLAYPMYYLQMLFYSIAGLG